MSSMDPVAAEASAPHFNGFLVKRGIDSYNQISLNTPEFLILDMLKYFYNILNG